MAVSKTYSQILWSAANTIDLTTTTDTDTSDALTLETDAFKMDITVQVENQSGTQVAGDEVVVKALFSVGDTDQDAAEEFDTVEQALILGTFYPQAESPTQKTVTVNSCPLKMKIYCEQSTTNTVTNEVAVRICQYSA